jgi:hypothetical protein
MSEQQENELICAKLLGWERRANIGTADGRAMWLHHPATKVGAPTPTFTTWIDAGLILDALERAGEYFEVRRDEGRWECLEALFVNWAAKHPTSGPLAIRAAALEYIRAAGEPGDEHG